MLCLNFIILQAKWHIYKNKLNNKHPFLFEFLTELKNAIEIERYIMIRNDSVCKFEQKCMANALRGPFLNKHCC